MSSVSDEKERHLLNNGLSPQQANAAIASEIKRVLDAHRLQVEKHMSFPRRLQIATTFFASIEGAVASFAVVALIITELVSVLWGVDSTGFPAVLGHLWQPLTSFGLIFPALATNVMTSWKLRRAEQIRPFAQVEEVLRVFGEESSVMDDAAEGRAHTLGKLAAWDPPSWNLITVYRDQQWTRIPCSMLAAYDIYKLRVGDVFPTDARRVTLTVNETSTQGDVVRRVENVNSLREGPDNAAAILTNGAMETAAVSNAYLPAVNVQRVTESATYRRGDVFWPASLGCRGGDPVPNARKSEDDCQPEEDILEFSSPVKQCQRLALATFQATSFACTCYVEKFLARSLQPCAPSSRRNTKFFELTRAVRRVLLRVFVIMMTLVVLVQLVWTLWIPEGPKNLAYSAVVWRGRILYLSRTWQQAFLMAFSFAPLVHRWARICIIQVLVSVWSLVLFLTFCLAMSLFQWLQDTRLSSGNRPVATFEEGALKGSPWPLRRRAATGSRSNNGLVPFALLSRRTGSMMSRRAGHTSSVSSLSSDNSVSLGKTRSFDSRSASSLWSSSSWSSSDSVAASVTSQMSVSRLPLRNQILELLTVFGQGLDGASNLLHTLNSTTSVVFVDKEGILTDTQRTVQELCVPEHFHKAQQRTSANPSRVSASNTTVVPYTTPERTTQIGLSAAPHPPPLQDRVVLDILARENATDGQRYEDTEDAQSHASSIRPLLAVLAAAKLPLSDAQYQYVSTLVNTNSLAKVGDFSGRRWLFAQTLRDILQCSGLLNESFMECVCSLCSISGVTEALVGRLSITRFMLVLYGRPPRPLSATSVAGAVAPGFYAAVGLWLLKDLTTGRIQLVTKGDSKVVLRQSAYYFDGLNLYPMTRALRRSLLELVVQWKSVGLEPVAVAYRPLSREQQRRCLYVLDEHSVFVVEPSTRRGSEECQPQDGQPARPSTSSSWMEFNIFPGPRSSIGGAPRLSFNFPSFATQSPSSPLFDYNNLLISPLTPVPELHVEKRASPAYSARPAQSDPKGAANVIKGLTKNQIFLGMLALRLSTPQELAGRVQSFHEAGIRFVYLSRENDKQTKAVGKLLGIETDWNCLISLAPRVRGVVNIEGNVVVPSGIDDIRRHLRVVDNVPLQVSLFSNGNPYTMRQMIEILQENGEVVTCIGSAGRDTNFDLFDQANCSISVAVGRSPVCKKCLGRRCVGHIHRHILPPVSKEFRVAAALTSLPCALHVHLENGSTGILNAASAYGHTPVASPSDPRWLAELLYEAFKESRRIVDAIQHCLPAVVAAHNTPVAQAITIVSTLIAALPLVSVMLLYSPAGEKIMREFPLRLSDHEESKREIRRTCLNYSFRFFPSSFACLLLCCHYFVAATQAYTVECQRLLQSDRTTVTKIASACENLEFFSCFGGRWVPCVATLRQHCAKQAFDPAPLQHTQIVAHGLLLFCIMAMSLSFIDRIESLFRGSPVRNVWLIGAWLFLFSIWVSGVLIELRISGTWREFTPPPYPFVIATIVWMGMIVVIDELVKKKMRHKYHLKQKFLRLLFTTRLGMWSPK